MLVLNVGSRDVIRSRKTVVYIGSTEFSLSLKIVIHCAKYFCQCDILPNKRLSSKLHKQMSF